MKKLILIITILLTSTIWFGCETTEPDYDGDTGSFKWQGIYDTVSFKVIELDTTTEWIFTMPPEKWIVDDSGYLKPLRDTTYIMDTTDNPICSERGHIRPSVYESTCMYCPDRYEEYADSTVLVSPGCNYITYTCLRCGKKITEKIPDTRTVIWRRVKYIHY